MDTKNNHQMKCFTIGHSNFATEVFLGLLRKHSINCLVDVRSSPYSKFVPQFNKENLSGELKKNQILYIYMGDKLGGRYFEPDLLYADGVVDYSKVMKKDVFQEGIQTLIRNIKKGFNISLMCSEKDPLDCHRFLLVSKALSEQGVRIKHILDDGEFLDQRDLENLLLQKYQNEMSQFRLFEANLSQEQALEKAYIERNKVVAYSAERVKEEA